MDQIVQFIVENSRYAPWMTMGLVLLAGFNIPISIDVVMVLSAFLAATTIPEHTFTLYLSLLVGCYFSAWIAYWVGRKIGTKLLNFRYFSKMLPEKRLKKIGDFYEKHGMLTLLIGRFIPFGMRNCIFLQRESVNPILESLFVETPWLAPFGQPSAFLPTTVLGKVMNCLSKRLKH